MLFSSELLNELEFNEIYHTILSHSLENLCLWPRNSYLEYFADGAYSNSVRKIKYISILNIFHSSIVVSAQRLPLV